MGVFTKDFHSGDMVAIGQEHAQKHESGLQQREFVQSFFQIVWSAPDFRAY